MEEKRKNSFLKVNDEVDLISILFVTLKNINLLVSIFLASLLFSFVYYLSSTKIFQSQSLLEIQTQESLNPAQAFNPYSMTTNSLDAEIEIYRSSDTINDVIDRLSKEYPEEFSASYSQIRNNLKLIGNNNSLLSITLTFPDQKFTSLILDGLNQEYIKDRENFKKESFSAARKYISQELPEVRLLLNEAEQKLNDFKLSTNSADIIFDADTRRNKLVELQARLDGINFRELELKEFYKTNHPIYMTLSEQKKLVIDQIQSIEKDLPEVPNRKRKIENLTREVKIYSDVIQRLSTQDINLSLNEASSVSKVRIINKASSAGQISPTRSSLFLIPLVSVILFFFFQNIRYFLNATITNPDALSDFVGKDRVIGELPMINENSKEYNHSQENDLVNELLHRTVYEITHSDKDFSSILFTSSRRDVGKTEVSKKIFEMLTKEGNKTCLLNFDYRKGSKNLFNNIKDEEFSSFDEFFLKRKDYEIDESLYIPSLKVDSIPAFFKSEEFESNLQKIKEEFDFIICDTPPWSLFVDAKIISQKFAHIIYVAGSEITTFKDIEVYESESQRADTTSYFFNKFNYFYNIFGLKYQYPYYANNYYYNYENYRFSKKRSKITLFFENLYEKVIGLFKK